MPPPSANSANGKYLNIEFIGTAPALFPREREIAELEPAIWWKQSAWQEMARWAPNSGLMLINLAKASVELTKNG